MARKHIVVAIPAYTGMVSMSTMHSLLHDALRLAARGDRLSIDDQCGSTDLVDIRAATVANFLETDGTHLVHVDNDVAWHPGALLQVVDHPADCVGGVYPHREDPLSFPAKPLGEDCGINLLKMEYMPGGFVCYARTCLEKMAAAYGDLEYETSRYPGKKLPGFWRELIVDGRKKGEDLAFFHRWRAIGGAVWCDPEISMAHVGPKAFIGCYGDWLRSQATGEK